MGAITHGFSHGSTHRYPWVLPTHARLYSIRCTDQSHILSGNISLRHLVRTLPPSPTSLSSLTVTNLERANITRLADIASWVSTESPEIAYHLQPHAHLPAMLSDYSAGREWDSIHSWLSHLTLQNIVQTVDAAAYDDKWTLALPRETRRGLLEDHIRAIASTSHYGPLDANLFDGVSASDASAVALPGPHFAHARQHVTFSAASTSSTVVIAISPTEYFASSLHGEIYGLIVALLLHPSKTTPSVLYTDSTLR